MRPIKVLFLETSLRIGGTENVLTQLMERLDRRRIHPVLCCFYEPGILGERLIQKGAKVYHNLARSRWDLGLPFRLYGILRRERPDILFIVNQPLTQFWGVACSVLARVPVRVTAIRSTGKINRIQRRLWVNRLTFPWVTRVTALSETHKNYLVAQEKIDPQKIEIIPNGVDLDRFCPNGSLSSLRQSLGISPHQAAVVGIVAMLRPEKGHTVFLKAAARVLQKVQGIYFLIVGEGPERSKLEGMAKELGMDAQVRFLGARSDTPELINLFDVALLSSHAVVETVSNSVLEYMACAKPVVAARVGSLEELVDHGQTGFLVEAGDFEGMAARITALLKNRERARRMGALGRKKVEERYSIDRMLCETMALFEKLVNGHTKNL